MKVEGRGGQGGGRRRREGGGSGGGGAKQIPAAGREGRKKGLRGGVRRCRARGWSGARTAPAPGSRSRGGKAPSCARPVRLPVPELGGDGSEGGRCRLPPPGSRGSRWRQGGMRGGRPQPGPGAPQRGGRSLAGSARGRGGEQGPGGAASRDRAPWAVQSRGFCRPGCAACGGFAQQHAAAPTLGFLWCQSRARQPCCRWCLGRSPRLQARFISQAAASAGKAAAARRAPSRVGSIQPGPRCGSHPCCAPTAVLRAAAGPDGAVAEPWRFPHMGALCPPGAPSASTHRHPGISKAGSSTPCSWGGQEAAGPSEAQGHGGGAARQRVARPHRCLPAPAPLQHPLCTVLCLPRS